MVQTHKLTDRNRFMAKELHQDHKVGRGGFVLLELLQFVRLKGLYL